MQQVHLDEVGQGRAYSLEVEGGLAHVQQDNPVEGGFAEGAYLPALRDLAGASVVAGARGQDHEGRLELNGRSGQEQERQQA